MTRRADNAVRYADAVSAATPAMQAELLAIVRPMWQAFADTVPEARAVLLSSPRQTGRALPQGV